LSQHRFIIPSCAEYSQNGEEKKEKTVYNALREIATDENHHVKGIKALLQEEGRKASVTQNL
jgi:rubrerythrin